jgi:hypothetical protein
MEELVKQRIAGLQLECDLLSAEIELYKSGEKQEFAYGRAGQRVDITALWSRYMRARMSVMRSAIAELRALYRSA